MLAEPNTLALQMSALRSERPDDIEYYSIRLESAFIDLGFPFMTSASGALQVQAGHRYPWQFGCCPN